MQRISSFLFLLIYDMRINLCGSDVRMSHQRLDGVYVNPVFQQQRGKGMPTAMKSYMLLYS